MSERSLMPAPQLIRNNDQRKPCDWTEGRGGQWKKLSTASKGLSLSGNPGFARLTTEFHQNYGEGGDLR